MFHNTLNPSKQSHYYINQDLNICVIESINTHNYQKLRSLLQPNTEEIIIINAIYATIHLIITDSYISRQILFNAHHSRQINIINLTGLTYLPEPEATRNGCKNGYQSKSILNAILEYTTKYKLLMIDIKILYFLVNQYNILNTSIIIEHIMPKLPLEYSQIFTSIFFNNNPNALEAIYKELQNIFANKLYIAVKSILDSSNQINNIKLYISILDTHHHLHNIFAKTLELLTTYTNNHTQRSIEHNQDFLLLLYSHHKAEYLLPDWDEEPIENSRLFRIYKHYNKI